ADGVILGNVATAEGWRYAVERVSAGAERAGRPRDDLRLVAWLYCALADDGAAAVDAVRPMVATSLVTSRPILDRLGIEMPPRFAAIIESSGWSLGRQALIRAAEAVPDDIVHRFALTGDSAACQTRSQALLEAVP